jgi:hypothetical protein
VHVVHQQQTAELPGFVGMRNSMLLGGCNGCVWNVSAAMQYLQACWMCPDLGALLCVTFVSFLLLLPLQYNRCLYTIYDAVLRCILLVFTT